ncbi:MAG: DUF2723 domain-containing protein [Candidatus Firestonebacteria bacterium]
MTYVKKYTSLIVFFVSLFVYLRTLCPTVYVGDSGELTTAALKLGIAHPPGYPVYCFLSNLFSIIPFGTPAFKINFATAVFSCCAAIVIYLLIVECLCFLTKSFQIGHIFAGLSGALCFSFSKELWSQSCASEVYSLNILFFVSTIYLLIKGYIEVLSKNPIRAKKYLYIFGLVYGVSLAHHHTMILFIPVYLGFIFLNSKFRPINRRLNFYIKLVAFLMLGLCFYTYLPIRSIANPAIDWGNPENISKMINHIVRRQYGDLTGNIRTFELFFLQCWVYIKFLSYQWLLVFLIFPILGSIFLLKTEKTILKFLIMLYLFSSLGFIFLLNFNLDNFSLDQVSPFLIPSYAIINILFGIGIGILALKIRGVKNYVYLFSVLFLPAIPGFANYFECDKSRNFIAYDYANTTLSFLQKGDVAFVEGDNMLFPLSYVYNCENEKNGAKIYDETGNVFLNPYGSDYADLPGFLHDKRKDEVQVKFFKEREYIYFTLGTNFANKRELKTYPAGLLFKAFLSGDFAVQNLLQKTYLIRGIGDKNIYRDYMSRDLFAYYFYFMAETYFARQDLPETYEYFEKSSEIGFDNEPLHTNIGNFFERRNMLDDAVKYYQKASQIASHLASVHNNLGYIYDKKQDYDKAIAEYETAIKIYESADSYNSLAVLYGKKGLMELALRTCEKAVKVDPVNLKALNNLGVIYANTRNYKMAAIVWQKALSIEPNYTSAQLNLQKILPALQ